MDFIVLAPVIISASLAFLYSQNNTKVIVIFDIYVFAGLCFVGYIVGIAMLIGFYGDYPAYKELEHKRTGVNILTGTPIGVLIGMILGKNIPKKNVKTSTLLEYSKELGLAFEEAPPRKKDTASIAENVTIENWAENVANTELDARSPFLPIWKFALNESNNDADSARNIYIKIRSQYLLDKSKNRNEIAEI